MANPVYKNTVNGADERVSTNGHWTGNQVGTVMQDAAVSGATAPYAVEVASVHVGTILRDAIDANFPTVDDGV